MELIKDNISRNRKHYHIVFDINDNPKTYTSSVLLKNYYRERDIEFQEDNDWIYYFIVRRHFLRKKKRENGRHWVCHYCGKPIYGTQQRNKLFQKSRKQLITIDHIHTKINRGDTLSTLNMVECCVKCNERKGTMLYDDFVKLINIKKLEYVYL